MKSTIGLILFGLLFSNLSYSGTITIKDWLDTDTTTANYVYTIHDEVSGRFTFNVSVPSSDADILGIAFTIDDRYNSSTIDLQNFSATAKDASTLLSPTDSYFTASGSNGFVCGNGCNFDGLSSAAPFDVILRIGTNGGSNSNWFHTITFDIDAFDLSLDDFVSVGIRAQSVLGNSSDKAYALVSLSTPTSVPEPSSLLFFTIVIFCSVFFKHRSKYTR